MVLVLCVSGWASKIGAVTPYKMSSSEVCEEGTAYADGLSEDDYSTIFSRSQYLSSGFIAMRMNNAGSFGLSSIPPLSINLDVSL